MPRDLSRRSTEPEQLDLGVAEGEMRRSLADLRVVNRWLGARRSLLRAVTPLLGEGGRMLDVGCGSADVPAYLVSRLPAGISAVGLDVKAAHLQEASPPVLRVVGDVRRPPFAPLSFDVVTASLVLHHFDEADLGPLLRGLFALARRALVVSDLHRARLPLLFGRLAFPLLFQSPVSVGDGLVSIRRGFRPDELRRAFAAADIPHVHIARRFPYRLLAVAGRVPAGTALSAGH